MYIQAYLVKTLDLGRKMHFPVKTMEVIIFPHHYNNKPTCLTTLFLAKNYTTMTAIFSPLP